MRKRFYNQSLYQNQSMQVGKELPEKEERGVRLDSNQVMKGNESSLVVEPDTIEEEAQKRRVGLYLSTMFINALFI